MQLYYILLGWSEELLLNKCVVFCDFFLIAMKQMPVVYCKSIYIGGDFILRFCIQEIIHGTKFGVFFILSAKIYH